MQQFVDGLLLLLTFWGSFALRYYGKEWFGWDKPIGDFSNFVWMIPVIIPVGPIALEMQEFYSAPYQKTVGKSLGQMARAALWLIVVLGLCVIFFKLQVPSRAVVLIFIAFAAVALSIRERLTVISYRRKMRHGRYRENVLLAGLPADVRQFRDQLTPDQLLEMNMVAEFNIETEPVSALVEALHAHSISRVIFAGSHGHMDRLQEAITACETEGVEAWLEANFIKTSIARPSFDTMGSKPMLVFRATPAFSWAILIKGAIDIVGALVLLVLSSPFMLAAIIGIKLTSPGPIIFRQQRGGKNGKPFEMYKFRTMHSDAEMRRKELEPYNQMSGPVFKIENDPRITGFGRWLRKTSIDELPQLFNVLKGEMSLVGPRPLPLYEVEKFQHTAQRRRLSVKPGLTCLWQVTGRNEVKDFQDWVRLDLEYIDNWSLWLDLGILLRTIPVVLLGLGAK
ncbi:MAG TPA: sugar transferase [Chthoniobacteraceae bacterium]|nr:sugar transferase [Chthoniobacteraceae bacterium]